MSNPDLIFEGDEHLGFWRDHPWAERVEATGDAAAPKTAIWLKANVQAIANDLANAHRPERPADLQAFASGVNERADFIEATPGVIAVSHFLEAMPDENAPDGWWGSMIWLDDPAARLAE